MRLRYLLPLLALLTMPAGATEIDFSTILNDLDGNPYRFCVANKPEVPGKAPECAEYVNHTVGLLAYGALNSSEDDQKTLAAQVASARRAVVARKVYPGKNEKHVVDLSSSEITLIFDSLVAAKLGIASVERLSVLELIDPLRVKNMLEK